MSALTLAHGEIEPTRTSFCFWIGSRQHEVKVYSFYVILVFISCWHILFHGAYVRRYIKALTHLVASAPAHVDNVTDGVDGKQYLHGGKANQVGHPVGHDPSLLGVEQTGVNEGCHKQQDEVVLLEGQGALVKVCKVKQKSVRSNKCL